MKNRHGRKTGFWGNLSRAVALAASLVCAGSALAAPPSAADIPDALKSWKAWVLHGQEARLCPEVAGHFDRAFCAWPGELKLEAQQAGMLFSQSWDVRLESAVPLPGSREYWPQRVTVDGKAHPVLERDGMPVVWLPPGKHAVNGWISWLERPQTMNVPESVALVSLTLGGKPVLPLERQGGSLSLGVRDEGAEGGGAAAGNAGAGAPQGDSVDFQVYRKLSDSIPAWLTTRVRFKVSGKARELSVADILPPRFVPVNIVSPWMARLDQNGRLQVQAMPGQETIEIVARLTGPLEGVDLKLPPERTQEIWSYEAVPSLRATTVLPDAVPDHAGKLIAVDPRQAGVPADWLSLPAFAVSDGVHIRIEERSRGQSERENQRLRLQREMWLDFSGEGFFTRDRIEGEMRQGWRFDVARPYTLERADSLAARAGNANWGGRQLASNALGGMQGLSAALLVTQGADESLTGVEWRQPAVTLNAGVRLAAGVFRSVPVTGWQQAFDSVDTTLHLPYGYRLIAAPGADSVSDNVWIAFWTILDIFLAAFFTLLAWKLLGRAGGIAAAVYLALAMPESFAPINAFALVLALALLRRAVPEGRLRGLLLTVERLALLCLVFFALVFIPAQIRTALYPQLEAEAGVLSGTVLPKPAPPFTGNYEQQAEMSAADEAMPAAMDQRSPAQESSMASRSVRKKAISPETPQRYAQSTVTQTGSGEPNWELGQAVHLHWSGPVVETQSVRFLISPPWLTRLLRVLMVVLLGSLIWRLFRLAFPSLAVPTVWLKGRDAASTVASLSGLCLVVLFAAALGFSTPVAAEPGGAFPPDAMLANLEARLLEPPECAPVCVDVPIARIDADARVLRVVLTAHVASDSSLPLPEPDEYTTLRGARVNGEVRPVLRFEGKSYLTLSRGIQTIQLEYALNGENASLTFPIRPAQIEFASANWQVEGIDEGHFLGETLNFSLAAAPLAVRENGTPAPVLPERVAQQFPPFVHVQRNFNFDLDWSIDTKVNRLAPIEGGFMLPVPILSGEHVTTPDVKVQDGRALAVFAARTATVSWAARLDKTETIELIAPPLSDRSETWRFTVSHSWHLDWDRNSENSVPVTISSAEGERVVFEFYPRPGEKLKLSLSQPLKADGSVRAIDNVLLDSRVGQHASDYNLKFRMRASQGGEHTIVLPPNLEVLDVQRDGVNLNLQPRENRLSLPVLPGVQTYALNLRQQGDVGLISNSPSIDLGLPTAANIDLRMQLGEQRWILAARGPAVGPAVLYWGELAV
ncbi:MAG: hypothetical protein LBU45_00365, partial [Azoarcus sp.]|nr:hypothetical protein [Azoarcus sp.]